MLSSIKGLCSWDMLRGEVGIRDRSLILLVAFSMFVAELLIVSAFIVSSYNIFTSVQLYALHNFGVFVLVLSPLLLVQQVGKSLKESEDRYRTTFERTGTAMLIIEENTIISKVNEEFERISGYTKKEIEGKVSWTQLVHSDDLKDMQKYHLYRRGMSDAPKKYEFRAIDKKGNIRDVFITVDVLPGAKQSVASLIDITHLKKLNKLLKALSEINELVSREKYPNFVLKTTSEKLNSVYESVLTSIRDGENLIPIESKGVDKEAALEFIYTCPSIISAMKGKSSIIELDNQNQSCKHCALGSHNYALSIPLIHKETHHGVITIHSKSRFSESEIILLEKLSSNIAFAFSAYQVAKERKKAFDQLAVNLMQFETSADRLRNPLAVISSALELKSEMETGRILSIVEENVERIKNELDILRKQEINTYKLTELEQVDKSI